MMARAPKDDQWSLKTGTAVLATCIVQTLNESDPTFQKRFLANLDKAYVVFRDGGRSGDRDPQTVLEMLAWTRELLTGFSFSEGQGKPLLKD
jgi:hypothetical protein